MRILVTETQLALSTCLIFLRWMDQSFQVFFVACGVPTWRELVETRGIVGTPWLEMYTRFIKPATYWQRLQVRTTVED